MVCDAPGCLTRSGPRATQQDLSLREFAAAGWFIARTHGDRCPGCVQADGGLVALTAARALRGGPGVANVVMSPPG